MQHGHETFQLGLPAGAEVHYVERVGALHGCRFVSDAYRRRPAHQSSAGKVLAAYNADMVKACLAAGLVAKTGYTITTRRRFLAALAEIRHRGWVLSVEESELGFSSVAAPVLDRTGEPRRWPPSRWRDRVSGSSSATNSSPACSSRPPPSSRAPWPGPRTASPSRFSFAGHERIGCVPGRPGAPCPGEAEHGTDPHHPCRQLPHDLLETMREKEHGRPYDPERFAGQVRDAVADVVRRQAGAGIDVVTDGEQGKVSFFTYITERLGGFSSTDGEPLHMPSWQREVDAFPEYYADYFAKYSSTVTRLRVMACRWPVTYEGKAAVQADIDNLRAALDGVEVTEAFLPSTSPAGFGRNEYYPSEDDYHVAVAEALREEYRAIVDAGFVLQVDDPWLIEILAGGPGSSPEESRRAAERHVEVLNHALDGLPTEQLRPHACYGERLGHASPGFTLNVYQHVVPGMQAEAAVAFSRLLSGDA